MMKNMNNKGFVYVETIVTAVILITTLVLLYNSYSKTILAERRRLYHDDVAYIYKTMTIRDIFRKSVNEEKFANAISKNKDCSVDDTKCKFIYFFNVESPIFNSSIQYDAANNIQDTSYIAKARKFYNFYQLAYVPLSDIPNLKKCINNGTFTDSDDEKRCNNTKNFIDSYANIYLNDYIKSLDVSYNDDFTYEGHEGILISMIFEAKNGEKLSSDPVNIAFGKYGECIENEVMEFYKTYHFKTELNDDMKKEARALYNNNPNLSFNMRCEYAYYISWVYL